MPHQGQRNRVQSGKDGHGRASTSLPNLVSILSPVSKGSSSVSSASMLTGLPSVSTGNTCLRAPQMRVPPWPSQSAHRQRNVPRSLGSKGNAFGLPAQGAGHQSPYDVLCAAQFAGDLMKGRRFERRTRWSAGSAMLAEFGVQLRPASPVWADAGAPSDVGGLGANRAG